LFLAHDLEQTCRIAFPHHHLPLRQSLTFQPIKVLCYNSNIQSWRKCNITGGMIIFSLYHLVGVPSIIRMIKSRKGRWTGYVASMGRREMRTARVFRRDSPPTRSRSIGTGGESSSMLTSVERNAVQAFSKGNHFLPHCVV
jgi:hypothetical protein